MSIDFTNRNGIRETVTITQGSGSQTRELTPEEPIAVLASGKDQDGGVKNISISVALTIFCRGDELGESRHLLKDNPTDATPGQLASTIRLVDWTFHPAAECPNGVDEIHGGIRSSAQNFHLGEVTTGGFQFTIR